MRLLLLKQLVAFLASVGIFVPHHALLCPPGHGPHKIMISCETIRF